MLLCCIVWCYHFAGSATGLSTQKSHLEVNEAKRQGIKGKQLHMLHFWGGNNNANVPCKFLKCLHVYYYSSRIEVLARVSIIDTYLLMSNEKEPISSSSRSPSVASTDDFSFFYFSTFIWVCWIHVDSWEDDKMVQTYVALVCISLTSFKDFKVFSSTCRKSNCLTWVLLLECFSVLVVKMDKNMYAFF